MVHNRGAQWRIWDLHVHTPATYGGEYNEFIKNAQESEAAVIGLNDYCTIKGYETVKGLGGIPGKIIFPVVEFRMHNLLTTKRNPNGVRINFHVVFTNDDRIFPKIKTWVQSLDCLDDKGEPIQLGTASDLTKISFDFEKVIKSLKDYNLYEDHALVWLPYDEYGGIDEIDPNTDGFLKLSLIKKAHIMGSSTKKQIDFFKWEDEKFSKEQFEILFDKPKPCIKGSDAHKINYPFGKLQNKDSQPDNKYCWIKADTTFDGLRQIIIEPDRVFIGEEPDLLKRVRSNKTKFIKSLSVRKTPEAVLEDVWFDDYHVELNSALVAIIGNKGGGKSAITDIISLCGNTYQDPNQFSFLTKDKFRNPRPFNLSEKFVATLTWEDGTTSIKKLNENPNKDLSERVKYIPQHFLERLCSNVDSDEFEKEIKQIIFTHTPIDNRFNKSSLDELINYKSSLVYEEISQLLNEISKVNSEIIRLEKISSSSYKRSIEDKLKLKFEELEAHKTNYPTKPLIEIEDDKAGMSLKELENLREEIRICEEEIETLRTTKSGLILSIEELNQAQQYYGQLEEKLVKISSNEHHKNLLKLGIDTVQVFSYSVSVVPIESKISDLDVELNKINVQLDDNVERSKTNYLATLNSKLLKLQEELDKPAKEHQRYLDDLKNWDAKKLKIEGDTGTDDTLTYYQTLIIYLDGQLNLDLIEAQGKRIDFIHQLYDKKDSLVAIRKELFKPVTKFIADFKELKARYDVKLDVSLEMKSFRDTFFLKVNQQKKGTFCGKEEGYKRLSEIVEKASLNSKEGFVEFTSEMMDNLLSDKRSSNSENLEIESQLKKGVELQELYDFIFGFEYLQPVYNLKLGSKALKELSPGERGALLLIFYLVLDNDDIPLIIDQPEENLDNESVYHILVHFIKKVKEKRQIIIVTHNPNLAIVCDADQIIHMNIDKMDKNIVRYHCGAIENAVTNKTVVNILEGTFPAFNNRDLKYIR